MARPLARGVLSFGLVAIPVEIHSAVKDESVSFHLLHAECGSRIRNRRFCPVCNKPLESHELVRGYEIEKGRYVRVTDAELDELEAESNSSIDLREFIPIKTIDPVYFERAYYLGAEEAGSKAYRLLADAMEKSGRVALAEMIFHNREKLVLIRPMKGGLVLQFMYHEEEVRNFDEIVKAESERLTPAEFDLATGLVEKLSAAEFEPEAYSDEYRSRVKAMLDQKPRDKRSPSRRLRHRAGESSIYLRGTKEKPGERPAAGENRQANPQEGLETFGRR